MQIASHYVTHHSILFTVFSVQQTTLILIYLTYQLGWCFLYPMKSFCNIRLWSYCSYVFVHTRVFHASGIYFCMCYEANVYHFPYVMPMSSAIYEASTYAHICFWGLRFVYVSIPAPTSLWLNQYGFKIGFDIKSFKFLQISLPHTLQVFLYFCASHMNFRISL